MKISELKKILDDNPAARIRFILPDQTVVPAHAHVTEVAQVDKRFIDCGGKFRQDSLCRLQTWVADDQDHRLTARKLSGILGKAQKVLSMDDLEVEVEYEAGLISQFPLDSVQVSQNQVTLHLSRRHTACLAQDQCCPTSEPVNLCTPAFTVTK